MYKRYQVLLNDWLADVIKEMAEKYDVSFSEVVRAALCLLLGQAVSAAYPKCTCGLKQKEWEAIIEKRKKNIELGSEEVHRFLSKLYFETRKSLECWQCEQQKLQKKQASRPE